ncbi:MAG TPA: hypothetical protein VFR09_01615, partial [Alphaproteobacteria bacterium]|nr:hypothetical protein [Alphaproteobacteria bacterium]
VYNDKYAIVQFDVENAPKITVIQSHTVAEAFRQQFYSLWNKGTLLSDPDMCDPVKERLKLM